MAVSLVNNLSALASQTRLNATSAKLNQTIQRLSSGLRINSSGDDAAGLSIANKYRSDVGILTQGVRNANDGISTLQIVDGGLNTISTLLDRAFTLSTQSASDTFTGNRDILQQEFNNILTEITRQAQNIGLVNGGTNNRALTTVIGGGSDTFSASGSNNGVQIDLSGASNRVDATSLSLSTLNIGSTTGTVTGSGGISFTSTTAALTAAETLTFQYVGATGALATTTVAFTAGQTANSVLTQLQNDTTLKAQGISASVSSGNLRFSSANFFTVVSSTAAANQTGIGQTIQVTGAANNVTVSGLSQNSATAQNLNFTIGASSTIKQLAVTGSASSSSATAALIATAINSDSTLRDAGIFAIYTDTASNGATVKIVSTKNTFYFGAEAVVGNAANQAIAVTAAAAATAGSGTGGAAGAKLALDSLRTAITTLSTVQGTVGSGQNRLQQAIDLATSQINNFQAAESRIRDADVSAEASDLARLSVLQQAGVAALAQANQASQAVLSLLRG